MTLPSPLIVVALAAGWTLLMVFLALVFGERLTPGEKKLFFGLISIPILLVTIYVGGHTIHENYISVTGGPVHWHADYQVWVCGERLDLINPDFPSNKIGSPVLHEHNDDRLHVEGTVQKLSNVNLGAYFRTIGGRLTDSQFVYPTDSGVVDVSNGDACGSQPGTLKVFVSGERIADPGNYLYYPHAYVPPGDCVIIDFSPGEAERTDRVCESWQAKDWDYQNYRENRLDYELPDYYSPYPAYHEGGDSVGN